MPGRSERQDQSSNDSKKKAVSRSESRARLMIAFLWTLLFVIEAILFGIAIASWQRGSVWSGLWWGIGGYVVLGIGAVFAYYFYVIEPAKTANPSPDMPDIPPDRPWMEVEVSAYGDISFDQNGNATFPIKFIANNSGRMPANKVGLDAKVIVPPFGKNHFTAPIKQRDAICGPALTTFGPFGFGTVFAGKNSELEIAFLVDARTMASQYKSLGLSKPATHGCPCLVGCLTYTFTHKGHEFTGRTGFVYDIKSTIPNKPVTRCIPLGENVPKTKWLFRSQL